ncbi:hypothetical protein PGB90_003521 [Kerria lacca]
MNPLGFPLFVDCIEEIGIKICERNEDVENEKAGSELFNSFVGIFVVSSSRVESNSEKMNEEKIWFDD